MKVKGTINVYDNNVMDYRLENNIFILHVIGSYKIKRTAKAAAERLAKKLNLEIEWEEV